MVVGERAVHFAEKFGHFVAQTFVKFACECAAYAVARVDGDFHGAFEFDVADDVVLVFAGDVFFGHAAFFVGSGQFVGFDQGEQFLDGLACEGLAAKHHFETVVIGRVVAAGNHHSTAAAFVDGGEIQHGCGDHADIEDVDAAVGKAALDVFHQFGTAQASVASECDAGDAFFGGSGGDGFADKVGGFVGQGFADNASDVVGFEDVAGNICHDGFLCDCEWKTGLF